MTGELEKIAGQCDGVRCDMAMLLLPGCVRAHLGQTARAILADGDRAGAQTVHPDFCFMAEVYWDLEWTLQQQGFDYTYDKRLYDRLREGHARPVREHLHAALDYQIKLARFLENHDEPRAAATFDPPVHRAAAVITYSIPGLRFFHQGQFEGRKKRISPHLVRAPEETPDKEIQEFYDRLLAILRKPICEKWGMAVARLSAGLGREWILGCVHCPCLARDLGGERMLIVVNYAPHPSQCYRQAAFSRNQRAHCSTSKIR